MEKGVVNSYGDLRVWQDAMRLAESCYRLTRSFPKEELFGLSSQVRRSASSIAANIAEGHGREHTRSFVQLLSERVQIAKPDEIHGLLARCDELGRMLRSYIRALQRRETVA